MQHYKAQIDAYVRGKLTPAEQSALELEILENPDMLMEFEMVVAMRKGVQELDAPLIKEVKSNYWWQPWIGRPMVTGVTMAVAVVALVQLASLSSRGNLTMDDQMPSALSANVPIMTFSRIRSARENTDFSVVADSEVMQAGLVVLELEIDWPPQPVYEVTIAAQPRSPDTDRDLANTPPSNQRQTGAGAVIDRNENPASTVDFKPQTLLLNPDSRGYLVMAMPSSQLSSGDYEITIDPLAPGKAGTNKTASSDPSVTDEQPVVTSVNNELKVAEQQVYTLRVKSAN